MRPFAGAPSSCRDGVAPWSGGVHEHAGANLEPVSRHRASSTRATPRRPTRLRCRRRPRGWRRPRPSAPLRARLQRQPARRRRRVEVTAHHRAGRARAGRASAPRMPSARSRRCRSTLRNSDSTILQRQPGGDLPRAGVVPVHRPCEGHGTQRGVARSEEAASFGARSNTRCRCPCSR